MGLGEKIMTNKVEAQATPVAKVRAKRTPFNAAVSKLALDKQDPNFHYRWINDEPGRIQKALAGDYVFVDPEEVGKPSDKEGRVSIHGGVNKDGSSMKIYLLKIPMDYYLEDKQTSQAHLDQIDTAIKGGKITPISNSYIPEGGISIKTK
jgi:hypothetical protein